MSQQQQPKAGYTEVLFELTLITSKVFTGSVNTVPSVNIFEKRLVQVWAEVFPELPVKYHHYETRFPVLLMLFLQAQRALIFILISQNRNQKAMTYYCRVSGAADRVDWPFH